MRSEPTKGQIYKHFKGNVYEIIAVAKHTESDERLVIYKSGAENATVYARPVEMFLSEVDHEKYPDVEAKFRFTLLDGGDSCKETTSLESKDGMLQEGNMPEDEENEKLHPLLEEFLDADSYEDKLEIFMKMRDVADRRMLSTVAVSLDVEITKDDVEEQFEEILYCIRMMEKFECNRLRRR